MHHIYCPYCEEMREEEEYSYTGEAHIERPKDPASVSYTHLTLPTNREV